METATSPPSTIAPLPFAQAVEALKRTAEGQRALATLQFKQFLETVEAVAG